TLMLGHAEEPPRVRREEERFSPGFWDRAHDHLAHRRHPPPLLIAEIGEAEPRTRVEDRMLGHEAIQPAFRLLAVRIVGRALIGEFGVSDHWRDRARIKQ